MSATPIPATRTVSARRQPLKLGASLYDAASAQGVGHASQEELKLLLNILRPKYFIPVHGEYRMLVRHARIAIDLGVAAGNAFVITNGDSLELDERGARLGQKVASGVVYVDGLGVGDVSQSVMRDRWSIGSDGIFLVVLTIERQTGKVIAGPDIVTKGFVPEEDANDIIERRNSDPEGSVGQNGEHLARSRPAGSTQRVTAYLYERTKRRPMVLPVIMQV